MCTCVYIYIYMYETHLVEGAVPTAAATPSPLAQSSLSLSDSEVRLRRLPRTRGDPRKWDSRRTWRRVPISDSQPIGVKVSKAFQSLSKPVGAFECP